MSKKKILTIALCVALVAALVVGASIAYFTDTKEATNTFTVGGVKIELLEKQRDYDDQGNLKDALVDFEQDKVLMPIADTNIAANPDEFGMTPVANYVDKMVYVKNTGKSDAYVRAYFAIPSILDDADNAGNNTLHFNFGREEDGKGTQEFASSSATGFTSKWIWKTDGNWNFYTTTIDGISYNVYYADYYLALAKDETTKMFVAGVYLDAKFDAKDVVVPATTEGAADTTVTKYYVGANEIDMSAFIDDEGELSIPCPVMAVAVQAQGFDTAAAAVEAAFGANFDPFNA